MTGINNLKELELKKQALKSNLTRGIDNPMSNIFSFLSVLRSSAQKTRKRAMPERNELIDEGVKTILTLIASAAASRLKLGSIPKMIITSGVALATPYIVDFVQKKIRDKKHR